MRARKPGVIRSQSLPVRAKSRRRGASSSQPPPSARCKPCDIAGAINRAVSARLCGYWFHLSRIANECASIGMRDLYVTRGLGCRVRTPLLTSDQGNLTRRVGTEGPRFQLNSDRASRAGKSVPCSKVSCSAPACDKKSVIGRDRLAWRKDGVRLLLYHGSDPNLLASVEPDAKYPFLFRVRYPDGHLSDVVNLTRAKDAACWVALRSLNSRPQEKPVGGPQARKEAEAVGDIGQSANRAQRPRHGLLARGRS